MELRHLPPAKRRFPMPARMRARRAERTIEGWEFPVHVWTKVAKRQPAATSEVVRADVERGLRDWFICCAWRGRRTVGMPSRLVDEAWHAFILDSVAYMTFCGAVFGEYLHHFPEDAGRGEDPRSLANVVLAWDRSVRGHDGESVLWDIDHRWDIEDPWGISDYDLARIRASREGNGTVYCAGGGCGASGGGGSSDAGSGDAGGGCGSGCGGGGCGGGS